MDYLVTLYHADGHEDTVTDISADGARNVLSYVRLGMWDGAAVRDHGKVTHYTVTVLPVLPVTMSDSNRARTMSGNLTVRQSYLAAWQESNGRVILDIG